MNFRAFILRKCNIDTVFNAVALLVHMYSLSDSELHHTWLCSLAN